MIGLFGIGEILLTMEEGLAFKGKSARISPKVVWQTWGEIRATGRSSALHRDRLLDGHHARRRDAGLVHGLRRGAALRSTRSSSAGRDRRRGGAETAAHAAGTSALLPMLTLGIPGSPTAAVLLGGLLIWGLQPGPMLFVEQKDFVWGLIASMYLGNLVGLIVVLTTVPWCGLLRILFSVIAPVIIVICAIGAYTVHNSMFDVVLMLVFGVLGYLFKKLDTRWRRWCWRWCWATWPRPASARRCCSRRARPGIFWSNGLLGSIDGAGAGLLLWPLASFGRSLRRREYSPAA